MNKITTQITYLKGDATCPQNVTKNIYIAHVCNDINKWGKGFVLALSKKWKEPEKYFNSFINSQ